MINKTFAFLFKKKCPKPLIFDVKKAFLQLKLKESDRNKLCFLWYADPLNGDYSIRAYRCLRVPFGLRPSPSLLMLSLFYILIYNVSDDDEFKNLKKLIYECFYMDNGAITSNSSLIEKYKILPEIFSPYGFEIQEFSSNDNSLKIEYPDVFRFCPI